MYILFLASTAAEALSNGNPASTSENATPTTSGMYYLFQILSEERGFSFWARVLIILQFGCRILKMVGPKMQDFLPKNQHDQRKLS